MSIAPQRIIFNRYQLLEDTTAAAAKAARKPASVETYTNEPIVQLDVLDLDHVREIPSIRKQVPDDLELEIDTPLFGTSLRWTYRGYIVQCLSTNDGHPAGLLPLNSGPAQPVDLPTRLAQIQHAQPIDRSARALRLCLFNVLVALEWAPHEDDLRQLSWAFRRASDFLYDVTDGRMAFGQVIFGGLELMNCADIQIMASNRLLPRSWVGGMHEPAKYTPIRLGRALWHKNNRVGIPWDEPEAYRTIVHEWAHYALELRDKYTERRQLIPALEAGLTGVSDKLLVRAEKGDPARYNVVIPSSSIISESIMATLEGTSELVPHNSGSSASHKSEEWKVIRTRYPWLDVNAQPIEGPGRLPLPLPIFGRQAGITATKKQFFPAGRAARAVFDQLPEYVQFDRCWLYLLKGANAKHPERIIAQGTFDARSRENDYRLLGGDPGDTIVLIDDTGDHPPVVLRGVIAADGGIAGWQIATPGTFPTIEMLPAPIEPDQKQARVSVRVTNAGGPRPDRVIIFPLGQAASIELEPDQDDWTSPPYDVLTLDGHVLVSWGDKLVISTFSQGGGPSSSTPGGPPPITAGSSDGNVLLFFHDNSSAGAYAAPNGSDPEDYSRIKVVTTRIHGMYGTLPPNSRARSYLFSISSNAPLPVELDPTLIMYYEALDERELLSGNLHICRLENGRWSPLPSYLPSGASFIATPLNAQTAGTLAPQRGGPRSEFFVVCWIPHSE